jgi:type IV pilus assembly protein PilC
MARSGVPVVSSLRIIEDTMTNEVYARAVQDMTVQVESGRTIGASLGDHREFDPMLVQMIAVGEETGQLDEMLGFVGDAYEQQIDHMSKNLPKVIEPILLIMLAGMVAIVALSLFLPIFRMVQVVENL